MDNDEDDNSGVRAVLVDDESRSAVNSLILDYYKKVGRKRDLEQYFSLSTAQSDIRDPKSAFWRKLKAENDSSDSGECEKKSDSPQELCRISIQCTMPDPHSTSQEEDTKTKTESESPPIIIEELSHDSGQNTDNESVKSDGNNSQKSLDAIIDTSMNKLLSPSSSITSQRKLEWDSLADVGYGNETDRKTSASSLSTLERLALKQQYSNNDTQHNSNIGLPTAHSTPLDEDVKTKPKKGIGRKSTNIFQKDVDFLELNIPHSSKINPSQSINVNLTKHISFNVESDGKVTVDNVQKDVNVSPEKIPIDKEDTPRKKIDKEIQTSLTKSKDNINISTDAHQKVHEKPQRTPILISLNTLRKRTRRKKEKMIRRKQKQKKKSEKENIPIQEKSGEQLSEAESFEYMPGHMYNQNQLNTNERPNAAGNKSSLESSGVITTDSSKKSKSFTTDLEKSIDLLRAALQRRCNDTDIRNQLIKAVCQRLIKSKYRDDDSTTDFLSGLSYSSRKLGLGEGYHTTTSTSEVNNSIDKSKRPKKSILRPDKFNSGPIASTSQSAPNLPVATNSENHVTSILGKTLTTSQTESDISSKEKTSSDNVFAKTSSEELYNKYLQAVKREEAYKRHLKDKEMFLKQKLVCSDSAFKVPTRVEVKPNNRLKDLIHDLTRNNYDDGSGDASKLEGGLNSNDRFIPIRNQRSHSVFTLSSGNSDPRSKKPNVKKRLQGVVKDMCKPGSNTDNHYCCCPHHTGNIKMRITEPSGEANKNTCDDNSCPNKQIRTTSVSPRDGRRTESPNNLARFVPDDITGEIKYVCLSKNKVLQEIPDNFFIYKCSRLNNKTVQLETNPSKVNEVSVQCYSDVLSDLNIGDKNLPSTSSDENPCLIKNDNSNCNRVSKSSQTDLPIKMLRRKSSDCSMNSLPDHTDYIASQKMNKNNKDAMVKMATKSNIVCEATRCIQTEISINPQIPEPSVSDINIVTDNECVKLISEHCRAVSLKPSIIEIHGRQAHGDAETCTNSESFKSSGTSKDIQYALYDDNHNERSVKVTELDEINDIDLNLKRDKSENYAIPIQGTKMTLMVSIGTSDSKERNLLNPDDKAVQISTEKNNVSEQATRFSEGYSKGVQAEMFEKTDTANHKFSNRNTHSLNLKVANDSRNKSFTHGNSQKPMMLSYTGLNSQNPMYDTYPKGSSVHLQKPLLRSNTVTGNFGECGIQTNLSVKKDAETQECYPIETQTSSSNGEVKILLDKCSCGCTNKIGDCKENCTKHQQITTLQPRKHSCDQIVNISSPTVQENCPCGCDGNKADCKVNCSDRKNMSSESYPENKKDKHCGQSVIDDTTKQKLKVEEHMCNCGCKGSTLNCDQYCSHRNKHFAGCRLLSLKVNQNRSTDTNDDKCLCGCGGSKYNCQKHCNQQKETLRCAEEPIVDKHDNKFSGKDKKCSCGCGGTIDNCKKDCIALHAIQTARKLSSEKKEVGIQKYFITEHGGSPKISSRELKSSTNDGEECRNTNVVLRTDTNKDKNPAKQIKNYAGVGDSLKQSINIPSDINRKSGSDTEQPDPILDMIQDITKRYSKKDIEKNKRKKCFKEIMNVLKYLLETDDSTDQNYHESKPCANTTDDSDFYCKKDKEKSPTKKLVDKGIQLPYTKSKLRTCMTESSDLPASTDMPGTSTDSGTCKVLNRIKKECEKYHQKRCKIHSGKKCDVSSSTSVNCDDCRRVHHCNCRNHKCKGHKKNNEKPQKKSVAYNLILETSESMASEGPACGEQERLLKNVVVKVPKKRPVENVPFNEMAAKFERIQINPKGIRSCRSRSLPNETEILSMAEIIRKSQGCTVREYLEKNRPDFVQRCDQRQNCLKYISETRKQDSCTTPNLKMVVVHTPNCPGSCDLYCGGVPMTCVSSQVCDPCYQNVQNEVTRIANQRAAKRDVLSRHLAKLSDVTDLDEEQLRQLAHDIGQHMRKRQPVPKFISEREMKKHSEKIYKSLPEVVQKKENLKKENIKKTNLLMANMFKRNLQKKTLRGTVNLSNYSPVVKI